MDKYRNNPKKKRKLLGVLKIVALSLVAATLLGVGLFAFSGGFADAFGKDRNKNNLITMDTTYIKTHNTNRGVEIDVDENGVIKLSGKATSDYSVKVASVKLAAGTYTISGLNEPDLNEFYMYVQHSGGQAISGTNGATFTLNAEETVTVYLEWADEYNFNLFNKSTVRPVIVEGKEAGSFYA